MPPEKPQDNSQIAPQYDPKASRLYQKTLDGFKLVNSGLSPKQALQYVNMTDHVTNAAVSRFNKKYKRYSISSPSIVKAAHNVVKDILKATPRSEEHTTTDKQGNVIDYTDNIYPSHANQLAAASMVYDRYEPAKQVIDSTSTSVVISAGLSELRDRIMADSQVVDMVEDKAEVVPLLEKEEEGE